MLWPGDDFKTLRWNPAMHPRLFEFSIQLIRPSIKPTLRMIAGFSPPEVVISDVFSIDVSRRASCWTATPKRTWIGF